MSGNSRVDHILIAAFRDVTSGGAMGWWIVDALQSPIFLYGNNVHAMVAADRSFEASLSPLSNYGYSR